ncbi:MAG TPA: T9SS type A sorting domain-containing protein, partial [Ignavibacteriaceae bacterium]
ISMGADQGYNYSRTGSAAQDLDLCQNYLKFNYRFDNGNVTGQNSLTGVSIDVGNIRGYTTSPVGAGFWPDAVQPLGSSVLYQYTGRGNTDSVAAVGVNESVFNTLSLFLDSRYFTNGGFEEVLLALIQEAISNGGSFMGFVPVELTSFTASVISGHVNLNWQTASETNNYGFEVERKAAEQEFSKVAFIAGYGTTTESKSYNYVDNTVSSGSYTYRLRQVDFDGTFEYSNEVEVDLAPSTYSLAQNYPNPFNPNTKIDFSLASDSKVTLKIFDVLGQEVRTLINGNLAAQSHSIEFNASSLNSGVYFYTIEAKGTDGSNFTSTKKMILTK